MTNEFRWPRRAGGLRYNLFGRDVRAFFRDGAFHQEHEENEYDRYHGENEDAVFSRLGRELLQCRSYLVLRSVRPSVQALQSAARLDVVPPW
jgi:hypothetical protein